MYPPVEAYSGQEWYEVGSSWPELIFHCLQLSIDHHEFSRVCLQFAIDCDLSSFAIVFHFQ